MNGPFEDLNDAQHRAVFHGAKHLPIAPKPVLVIAGAGSGKTRVIAARIAKLLASGVRPDRILALTFTNRAAKTMIARARHPSEVSTESPLWAGTFHSVGARLLRTYGNAIGIESPFTVLDRSDSSDLMGIVKQELGLNDTVDLFPTAQACVDIHSLCVNSCRLLKKVLKKRYPDLVKRHDDLERLFERYVDAKRKQMVLDYDDLLAEWLRLIQDENTGPTIRGLFDHVLVDEYQDTNRLQEKLILALKPKGDGVFVVGDDAQSIYSFRAAEVKNILRFPERFSPEARVITLEQNYRSRPAILDACNQVIGLAKERFTKNLFSKRKRGAKPFLTSVNDAQGQAKHIASQIARNSKEGIELRQQAVLFRRSRDSGPLEIELTKRGIPFVKWGGLKFVEAAHVKDIANLMRWVENPQDRLAGSRTLKLLSGLGDGAAASTLDALNETSSVWKQLKSLRPARTEAEEWRDFYRLIKSMPGACTRWPYSIELALDWYKPYLQQKFPEDWKEREEDLAQLLQIAASHQSCTEFLSDLSINPPDGILSQGKMHQDNDDYVILSTIHSAKGQEWRNVWVLNLVDGGIPSSWAGKGGDALEEERRLLYVAMTRARDRLELMVPLQAPFVRQGASGDMRLISKRSRFLPRSLDKYFNVGHAQSPEYKG